MNLRFVFNALASVLVFHVFVTSADAQAPQYIVSDLGTLGGASSSATSINDSGQITGNADTANGIRNAFLYSSGVMTDIDTLGSSDSLGSSINASGQIVGSVTVSGVTTGFLYSAGGINILNGTTDANAINDGGQTTGDTQTGGFLYTAGVYQSLGSLSGAGGGSSGLGLNNLGQVVGDSSITRDPRSYSAFLLSGGSMIDLDPEHTGSIAWGINDSGQVTGEMLGEEFLYDGGQVTLLGTLGGSYGGGIAINTAGEIVGSSWLVGDSIGHATLYTGGTLYDLNNLSLNLAGTDFSYLESAEDINDNGTIVGYGMTAEGSVHAFEAQLVATPEPGVSLLLSLAAPAWLLVARRHARTNQRKIAGLVCAMMGDRRDGVD